VTEQFIDNYHRVQTSLRSSRNVESVGNIPTEKQANLSAFVCLLRESTPKVRFFFSTFSKIFKRSLKIVIFTIFHFVRNLHLLSKNSTLISRENCRIFFRWRTRENVVVFDFLAVDNFDFTRKFVKTFFSEKLVKTPPF